MTTPKRMTAEQEEWERIRAAIVAWQDIGSPCELDGSISDEICRRVAREMARREL